MKKTIKILAIFSIISSNLISQTIDMSAVVRPRFESRNGYKTLLPTNIKGANFVSQRTRLNLNFKNNKLKLGVSLQNVRVWGDVSTLASSDLGNSFHQAWAEGIINEKLSFKLGRQEIIYDDSRIFGNVGWAQQARSHDAALLKYQPNKKHKLDIGLAFNSDKPGITNSPYSNVSGYKTFQYVWYHGIGSEKFEWSVLALNTGVEYLKPTQNDSSHLQIDFVQTVGTRLTYKEDKFSAHAAAYIQTGKSYNTKVNALYFAADVNYKINNEFSVGAGFEYLSGKDQNDTTSTIKSFNPIFGTNHKFNGWMDYFYVGNHGNNVGLMDANVTLAYKKEKFSAKVIPHMFYSAANLYDFVNDKNYNKSLGTEVDLVVGYKIAKDINLQAGFSMMFASESMNILKGVNKTNSNTWGWVMITFNPKVFSKSLKK